MSTSVAVLDLMIVSPGIIINCNSIYWWLVICILDGADVIISEKNGINTCRFQHSSGKSPWIRKSWDSPSGDRLERSLHPCWADFGTALWAEWAWQERSKLSRENGELKTQFWIDCAGKAAPLERQIENERLELGYNSDWLSHQTSLCQFVPEAFTLTLITPLPVFLLYQPCLILLFRSNLT